MIHKDLCHAKNTTYWTKNQIRFHFLLSSSYDWNGEIHLTIEEISQKLNVHVDTAKLLIKKSLYEGVLRKEGDRLFFTKVVREGETYVKHLPFLDSDEFYQENINVIRFVLHMLWTGVYSHGYIFNMKLDKLFHKKNRQNKIVQEGLFNIYHAKTIREVLEKAKKYLVFFSVPDNPDIVRVVNVKPEYNVEKPTTNIGEHLHIAKEFKKVDMPDISFEVLEEIVKVKSTYKKSLGVEAANEIGIEALRRALGKDNSQFLSLVIQGESKEIGQYYRAICEEVELEYAAQLERRKINLENALNPVQRVPDVVGIALRTFNKVIQGTLQKVKEEIRKMDAYLSTMIIKKYDQKERVKEYIAAITINPLSKHLEQFQSIVQSLNRRKEDTKGQQLLGEFDFYNWLEMES